MKNILYNTEKNIAVSLSILHDNADVEHNRSDFENWLPIELIIDIDGEVYHIGESCNAMMSVLECSDLIQGLKSIINSNNDAYIYHSSEALFSMELELLKEDDVVEVVIWINLAAITGGNKIGYDRGVRFITTVKEMEQFYINLSEQYRNVMGG